MFNQILPILLVALALFATACTPSAPANTSADTEPAAVVESTTVAEAATEAPAEEAVAEEATEALAEEAAAEEATTVPAEEAPATAAVEMTKLNLNTVSGDELLATIPDFGNRMVREFQEYRPYVSIQQFRREIGKYVDDSQVAFYEEYVYVPVSANDSDAETIMQIPGVDAATADALVAARPYDSNNAFLQKLVEVAPAVDGTLAAAYLEAE